MKCDWVRQNILFYVYNELEDDARYEVEQHLGRCPECATELKATRKLHATLSRNAGGGADSEPARGLADAPAGSARNDAAGGFMASADS
jgi:anti-sigma factor RsiW